MKIPSAIRRKVKNVKNAALTNGYANGRLLRLGCLLITVHYIMHVSTRVASSCSSANTCCMCCLDGFLWHVHGFVCQFIHYCSASDAPELQQR
jgi:hypothetical protein